MRTSDFHFRAKLDYLSTEEGGRTHPANSGIRPTIRFPFEPNYYTSGHQEFIGRDSVKPGETIIADIAILSFDHFKGKLSVGDTFEFSEGSQQTGNGQILEIYQKTLLKA